MSSKTTKYFKNYFDLCGCRIEGLHLLFAWRLISAYSSYCVLHCTAAHYIIPDIRVQSKFGIKTEMHFA